TTGAVYTGDGTLQRAASPDHQSPGFRAVDQIAHVRALCRSLNRQAPLFFLFISLVVFSRFILTHKEGKMQEVSPTSRKPQSRLTQIVVTGLVVVITAVLLNQKSLAAKFPGLWTRVRGTSPGQAFYDSGMKKLHHPFAYVRITAAADFTQAIK